MTSAPSLVSSIGPWRIVEVLGQGGMGVVYRAEHATSHRAAALKTVKVSQPQWLAGIRREIFALTRVRHPGVVRIVAQGVATGRPWYAMELLEGETLRSYTDRLWKPVIDAVTAASPPLVAQTTSTFAANLDVDSLPDTTLAQSLIQRPRRAAAGKLKEGLSLFRRLCATLAFLHGEGIIHCDLKPDNVFLVGDTPVIVDFGLMSNFRGGIGREAVEASRGVVGTVAYMAPEQIRNEFVDARTDLYAVGCMLYALVTGVLPFQGPVTEVLRHHLFTPVRPPSEFVADLPRDLENLILRLLRKDLAERIGYADDVAAALADLGMPDAQIAAWPAPRPYLYRPQFAGRKEALAQLEWLRAAADKVAGALVLVGGESGVGKTRFVMQATRLPRGSRMQVIASECNAPSAGAVKGVGSGGVGAAPLAAWKPLLQSVADACHAGGRAATDKLLGARGRVLAMYEPSLSQAPGLDEQPAPLPLPPEAARARLFTYLAETLFAFAAEQPLFLIVDDLQWADELSLAFLHSLSPALLAKVPLLLVCTYRSEEAGDPIRALAARATAIRLELLDDATIRSIVRDMLAFGAPPEPFVRFLTRHTDGNPFFVAEYLRAAVAEGIITRNQFGSWRIDAKNATEAAYEALPLPRTLRDLVSRRLDGLAPSARALLEMASVIGREMESDTLLAAAGLDESDGLEALGELLNRQILEYAENGDGGRLRFLHDKLREVAYEGIVRPRLRELHRTAAIVLEARYRDRPDFARLYVPLARHFAAAAIHDRAAQYFGDAADHARRSYANDDAIALYREAAVHATETLLSSSVDALSWRDILVGLHERLADVLALTGRRDKARAEYDAALARSASEDRIGAARLHRKLGNTWETQHQHAEALANYALAERTLGPQPEGGDPAWREEWVQIQIDLIWVNYWLGRVPEMNALVEKLRPVVGEYGTAGQRAKFFLGQLQMQFRKGRYLVTEEALAHGRDALSAAEESGDFGEIPMAQFNLGLACLLSGRLPEADRELRGSLALAERAGDVALKARCLTYLTFAARMRHDLIATRDLASRSLAVASAGGLRDYVASARANQAWLALCEGDLVGAEAHARFAIETWDGLTLVFPLQWAARLPLVEVKLDAGDVAEAAAHGRALLDERQQRLPDDVAQLLKTASEAVETGSWPEAQAALSTALQRFREMGYL